MWFDVGIKRYTTTYSSLNVSVLLWFDVGIKRYTTKKFGCGLYWELWFDVGIKRYTTRVQYARYSRSCGLM